MVVPGPYKKAFNDVPRPSNNLSHQENILKAVAKSDYYTLLCTAHFSSAGFWVEDNCLPHP